jgi:hypothetical protein
MVMSAHWLWRTVVMGLATVALLLVGVGQANADVFYAAQGSNGVNGNLYTLNPATGAPTLVAPLLNAGGQPYGLTGLAFQPGTGTFYGVTSGQSPTQPGWLVTVNPANGLVTPIAPITGGNRPADISFSPGGTLYGWEAFGAHRLESINPATGVATPIGAGLGGGVFGGEGIAVRADGTIFITPDGQTGPRTLRTVDPVTGVATIVGPLTGLPAGFDAVNALDFDSAGTLFGIATNEGFPALTHLISINTATGAVTDLGPSANNLDALGILRQAVAIPEPASLALFGLGALGLVASRWWRKSAR